jgi:pyruvate formate lyase activating enzyme
MLENGNNEHPITLGLKAEVSIYDMKIKGFIEESLIDWPGKISAVIFTSGCNLRCPYCHNPEFVSGYDDMKDFSKDEIFKRLSEKKKWLDGVVISGGEPTLQSDLPLFLMDLRDAGYKAKLETNGTNPRMLDFILSGRLAECISMDVKWPLKNYKEMERYVLESINLIKNSNIDYEFNTTVVPGIIGKNELMEICKSIEGAKKYTLQQFKSDNVNLLDKSYINKKPYSAEELNEFLEIAKPYVKECRIRG